jgi:glycerol dehydrogenase
VTDEDLRKVAAAAAAPGETIHFMPFEVTPDMVFSAIKAADAVGRAYSNL